MSGDPQLSGTAGDSVAVVGAGVVGLLTAWELRRRGFAVTVMDPQPVSEASFAAAGMLAPTSETQYGQDVLWDLMARSRDEYPQLIADLEAAAGVPSGYLENGTLMVAADAGDRAAVADMVQVQQSHGMDVQPMTGSHLRRSEPGLAPGLSKAWAVPQDHQVDPRILAACVTTALNAPVPESNTAPESDTAPDAKAAPEGATAPPWGPPARWITARVTAIDESTSESDKDQVTVSWVSDAAPTIDTAQFSHVILTPGMGYSGLEGLPARHRLPLRPVHGDVLRLAVTPGQLLPGETHVLHATVRARVAGRAVYMVPREDGGLVVGASSREDSLTGTHAGSVAELLHDAIRVLPAVRDMELVEITSRARPGTPDDRPYLGVLGAHRRVVVSTGYFRHGILLAPLAARLGAALVAGEQLGNEDRRWLEVMDPQR